jgi:AraC-like DNA-binding protein
LQAVQKVKDIAKTQRHFPLERVLGQGVQVLNSRELAISNCIKAEWLEVNFPDNKLPEEHARLLLFPIAEREFCLQLAYIQPMEGQPFTAKICWLEFLPGFFAQYPAQTLMANMPFSFDQTTEQQFNICAQTKHLLQELETENAITPLLQSLQHSEIALRMLRRGIELITLPFTVCQVPACRFLAHDSEREKVMDARRIIDQNIDQSFTIKELSRKVAMNECYLKKGFKALVGKTIHEYQQELRIAKAKQLLQQQGQSVSDVANSLGYSSISHFSTAFKKATGMKPCELLA